MKILLLSLVFSLTLPQSPSSQFFSAHDQLFIDLPDGRQWLITCGVAEARTREGRLELVCVQLDGRSFVPCRDVTQIKPVRNSGGEVRSVGEYYVGCDHGSLWFVLFSTSFET